MTQFVRTFVLALTYGRLPARSRLRKLGLGVVVMSGLIAAVSHAEEAKRCAEFAARLDSLEGKVQWQVSGDSQWQSASLNQTFCYGDIILVQEKRAALRLSNNTLVRLNENSSIKLIPPQQSFWVELIDGAAHFLTRTPKSFTVKAPFVNAAVEGTEFLVTASNGVNQVGVIEGVVRSHNPAGSVLLTQGMSTQTGSTQQAPGAPVQLKLNDFVSWAMYFPPLPNRLNLPADIKTLLEQGRDGEVIARISKDAQASAEILSLGAALALNRGQLPQAEELVQRAFKLNPKHPDAQAIAALVDLGRGEAERGQQRAAQNVLDNPFNPTALIAHSYSQQGQGRLQGALDSALEARRLTPTDSQIIARVAELHLALGQKAAARKALDEALALAPNHSRLLTFKGFSLLAERKGKTAQTYFAKASQQDSADPYAQLGWGLSLIQQGKLESAREHLELAVILDPANSLLRSYLGKGYFEENRLKLAETQLNLAQTLDPNDPTPWYYLSQVKHDQHRYGEALQLVETSIDKNTNRAVYRAEGAIGSDAAARLADKSRIYQAMGADQLAISAASDAIRTDPNDYAGHRAMAMALTGKEGNQTARANEALQASLLAPIGATPLAPGFAETAMQVLPGAGPHEMGINEYNAAFSPNGINGFVSVLGAGNNTRATEGQVQLVGEKTDLSLGQYHYSSDGFRENNDRDYLVNELRLKNQITNNLWTQITAAQREDDFGDISETVASEVLDTKVRSGSKKEYYSFGVAIKPYENLLVQALKLRKREKLNAHFENYFPGVVVESKDSSVSNTDLAEINASLELALGNISIGYGSRNITSVGNEVENFLFDGDFAGEPDIISYSDRANIKRSYLDYLYRNDFFAVSLGGEYQDIENFYGASNQFLSRQGVEFECFWGGVCSIANEKLLSFPILANESLRIQVLDLYGGAIDFVPYSLVRVDSFRVNKSFDGYQILAGYQEGRIRNPPGYLSSGELVESPKFVDRSYLFEISFNALRIDTATLRLKKSDSVTRYSNIADSRADIPHKATTETTGVSFGEHFGHVFLMTVDLNSVDQKYLFPLQLNDDDLSTRARFVNLDFNFQYESSRGSFFTFSALNFLDNSKSYINGSPANFSYKGMAELDSYIAERVFSLSAKLVF